MTRRETGYLLTGLGTGLVFAEGYLGFWLSQMFIMGLHWHATSVLLLLPFLLILCGLLLVHRGK